MTEAQALAAKYQYDGWNKQLLQYCFFAEDEALRRTPVDRIPASPEDLCRAIGLSPDEANIVAEVYVRRMSEALPRGESFGAFCFGSGGWTPDQPGRPRFFAMLWMTCLAAWGYPDLDGGLEDRLRRMFGRTTSFHYRTGPCLPQLWEDLAEWTRHRHAAGDLIRELHVPPYSEYRAVIGASHFLAFPNRHDRTALARVLWERGLVGFEPPIGPVLSALTWGRAAFSREFRDDLEGCCTSYARGDDPRESAFWRAVRREALTPSVELDGRQLGGQAAHTALLVLLSDDGLEPVVACSMERAPPGFDIQPLDAVEPWISMVVGTDGDAGAPCRAAFSNGHLLGLGTRMLIQQGVLVLRHRSSWLLEVVSGADIQGCQYALVRGDRTDAFVRAFAGTANPALVDGWFEVHGARVTQLDALPQGLEDVLQLLRTMEPPSTSFVGGIRAAGGFLFVPAFLPHIRAPSAARVELMTADGREISCARVGEGFDWNIPLGGLNAGQYRVRASWTTPIAAGGTVERTNETDLTLVAHVLDADFKPAPAGAAFVEGCSSAEIEVPGATSVPFVIAALSSDSSADLLEFDSSARYLGPGVGEMSLVARPGYDWLATGHKKSPDVLVFAGDVRSPVPPANRQSPRAGDRRHWRQALRARRVMWRDENGTLAPLTTAPRTIANSLSAYQKHTTTTECAECDVTGLASECEVPSDHAQPDPRTQEAVDVLAALSIRRSGLRYREVRDVFEALTSNDSPLLFQQVLRGWAECGLVDVLRTPGVARMLIVARTPRFVFVRRAGEVEGTICGLITSPVREALNRIVASVARQIKAIALAPANPWQPNCWRARGTFEALESIRREVGMAESLWLDWPDVDDVPLHLDARQARGTLSTTTPPPGFRTDAVWDWSMASFDRGSGGSEAGVAIERRIHRDWTTIYVVLVDGSLRCWTYSRTWALLVAHEARGTAPFVSGAMGWLTSEGRSPVHLPLPLGRLCVLVGDGLPGPILRDPHDSRLRYRYPFGRRLWRLVERVLPQDWVRSTDQER